MTDRNMVDICHDLPPLQFGKRWKARNTLLAMLPALKLLLTVSLLVTLGGCVSSREGDYETPFVQGSQPHAP